MILVVSPAVLVDYVSAGTGDVSVGITSFSLVKFHQTHSKD